MLSDKTPRAEPCPRLFFSRRTRQKVLLPVGQLEEVKASSRCAWDVLCPPPGAELPLRPTEDLARTIQRGKMNFWSVPF